MWLLHGQDRNGTQLHLQLVVLSSSVVAVVTANPTPHVSL